MLGAGARPSGGVGQKIYDLVKIGWPEESLCRAVELIENIDWTIAPAEQGHVMANKFSKEHDTYCQDTVMSRAQLGQMSPLWPKTKVSATEAKVLRRLAGLERRRPASFQGRHAFLQDLIKLAKAKVDVGLLPAHTRQIVMAKHAARWDAMPDDRKRNYDVKAAEERAKKARAIIGEREECVAQLAVLKQRKDDDALASGPQFRLSLCNFSEADVQEFDRLWDDKRYSKTKVAERRTQAVMAVGPPSDAERQRLEAYEPYCANATHRRPGWVQGVAHHRTHFANALFRIDMAVAPLLWRFVFAMQSPILVSFLRAEEIPVPHDASGINLATVLPWAAMYKYEFGDFAYSDQGEWPEVESIQVNMDTHFIKGARIASDADWRDLEDVLLELPVAPLAEEFTRPPAGVHKHNLVAEFPWLVDFLGGSKRPVSKAGGGEAALGGGGGVACAADGADAIEMMDAESVFDELYAKRLEVGVAAGADDPFTWGVLGGAWTAMHLGVAFDAFSGRCATQDAKDFVKMYRMAQTFRCSIRQYGELACGVLCAAWVSKMTYFYRMWEDAGFAADFRFGAVHWDAPAEFVALGVDAAAALEGRMQQIRDMRPSDDVLG
jgi:hypothetical protein